VNGASQGTRTSGSNIFTWPVTLASGSNFVQAVGTKGATQVSDSLTWLAPFSVAITNPAAPVVFLNSTNDTLQLAGSIPSLSGPVTMAWSQLNGPGIVTFGSSNALATT